MKTIHWIILVFLAVALAAGAGATDEKNEHDHAREQERHGEPGHQDGHADEVVLSAHAIKTFDVRVEPAGKQILSHTIIAPARVAFNAEQIAHVSSSVTGRIAEIKARLGDAVQKGDVLLVVDSPELGEAQSDYVLKRTAIPMAQSSAEAAGSAFDRARRLYDESKGIALAEVQKREAEFRAAQGALLSAQAAATAAENKLHLFGMSQDEVAKLAKTGEIDARYFVRAPLEGQVIEREATLGELVRPEREALLVLANLQTLWVLADVPETKLEDLAVGAPARIHVASRSKQALEGAVTFISPQLDPSTRAATVRIEVRNGHALRPGMFARAELRATPAEGAQAVLAVPDAAVQTVEGSPAVFVPVEGEDGTFAKRAIKVGPAIGGMLPVLAGLNEGEKIVVSGTFILKAELGKGSAGHEH